MNLSFTTDPTEDGILQFTAGLWFIQQSKLLIWRGTKFTVQDDVELQCREIDETFGRVHCWTTFSIGAEYLLKGALLANGIEIRTKKATVTQPSKSGLMEWCQLVREQNGETPEPRTDFADYGTLWNLIQRKLVDLIAQKKQEEDSHEFDSKADLMYGAFVVLTQTIRNRDAHAYVPNVRQQHEDLLRDMFVPAFNLLVKWMPGGARVVQENFLGRNNLIKNLVRPMPMESPPHSD